MYKIILLIHIFIGAIALISGAIAIFSKKGAKLHIASGKVYYLSMCAIGVSAIILTFIKFNPFLLAIAIFSLYLTYSGKRAITFWRLKKAYIPLIKDKIPVYLGLLTAIFMIAYPIVQMINKGYFGVPVLSVFGAILLIFCIADIRTYSKPLNFQPKNKQWLLQHIARMGAAYISTVTAFVVNNIHLNPQWITWLLPTAIGVPLIFLASAKWAKKLRIA